MLSYQKNTKSVGKKYWNWTQPTEITYQYEGGWTYNTCAKKFIIANLDVKIGLTEITNRALRAKRFTIQTWFKLSPFELHHVGKLRALLTDLVKDNKSHLSDWTTLKLSVPPMQNRISVAQNEKLKMTDYIIMARKRKITCCTSHKSQKRRLAKLVGVSNIHILFLWKETIENHWKGNIKENRELP